MKPYNKASLPILNPSEGLVLAEVDRSSSPMTRMNGQAERVFVTLRLTASYNKSQERTLFTLLYLKIEFAYL